MGIRAPARLRKVAEENGITADIKVYPDAGHSCESAPGPAADAYHGFGYNEAAAEDAWSRVFAFFEEHLS